MAGGDWLSSAAIDANGSATMLMSHNNAAVMWEVEQISVSVGAASTTGNIAIFKNGNLVAPTAILVPQKNPAGTASIGQAAAGLPYVYLHASDIVQVVISGATAGDSATMRAQFREFSLADPAVQGR